MKRIDEIEKLVQKNYGQMSYEEYQSIYNLIIELSPCNLLVFGMGRDSYLWTKINSGYTLFIEDDPFWIEKIKPLLVGNYEIFQYKYNTDAKKWLEYLDNPNILNILKMKFENKTIEEILYETDWDIIIIDGPIGIKSGRMIPISTVYSLKKKICFIHDCDRMTENIYTRVFFGNDFKQIDKLRIY